MPDDTEQITKRRVTMTSTIVDPNWDPSEHGGVIKTLTLTCTDYVPDDERGLLEPYLADARTRWQHVSVSRERDAGPGGYHGKTVVPETLSHPSAGKTFAATKPSARKANR